MFIQQKENHTIAGYVAEIDKYNKSMREFPQNGEALFLESVKSKYAEFESLYNKALNDTGHGKKQDLLQFLMDHSEFLNRDENKWMLMVIEVVRSTSLYFQPQIRTKILNEGWASYWHENLFLNDDRISGHEVDFAGDKRQGDLDATRRYESLCAWHATLLLPGIPGECWKKYHMIIRE